MTSNGHHEFLDTIKARIPDYAKDIRLNLDATIARSSLDPQREAAGAALAAAFAARSPALVAAIRDSGALDDARRQRRADRRGADGHEQRLVSVSSRWRTTPELEDAARRAADERVRDARRRRQARFELYALAASHRRQVRVLRPLALRAAEGDRRARVQQLRDVGRIAAVVNARRAGAGGGEAPEPIARRSRGRRPAGKHRRRHPDRADPRSAAQRATRLPRYTRRMARKRRDVRKARSSSSSSNRRCSPTIRSAIRMSASSPSGCRRATTRHERGDAAAGAAIPVLVRPRRLHRLRARAPQLAAVRRERPRARSRGSSHEREDGAGIVVFPDCFTCLGGNQYVNSSAIGRYADYLTREIVPFVDREFRTLASRDHRGCFGKSSGGYGAIVHGMRYREDLGRDRRSFGRRVLRLLLPHRLAAHAERARPLPAAAAREPGRIDVRARRDAARIAAATTAASSASSRRCGGRRSSTTREAHALMMIAMAATYDPDPKAPLGFRLPVNLETGEIIPTRWDAWLAHDPIHMVATLQGRTLRSLRGIYHRLRLARPVSPALRRAHPVASSSRSTASRTSTRSSTTRTRRSTTGWT